MSFWKRHQSPSQFFSKDKQERIVAAIRRAEEHTSGEIRVHLALGAEDDIMETARRQFEYLGMAATRRRNGVLLYLALADRRFALYGDEAVHRIAGNAGWDGIRDDLAERFRRGEFCAGVCEAIERVGETLRTEFPAEPGDANELSDAISTDDTE